MILQFHIVMMIKVIQQDLAKIFGGGGHRNASGLVREGLHNSFIKES